MRAYLAALALAASSLPAFADTSMTCKAVTESDVSGLFDRWNASLKTGNPMKSCCRPSPTSRG